MLFTKLDEMIPYVTGGKQKILSMAPYTGITLRLPGRHADQTLPVGGDFVICVSDDNVDWTEHQFTHTDLFKDIEGKTKENQQNAVTLLHSYKHVITGEDPNRVALPLFDTGIHTLTFLYAVQALAVAEHRRYAQHEAKWGGRYLPFRFVAGIVEGLWTAADAAGKQKYGRPGVQQLEREYGTPLLTVELMS